MVDLGRLNKHIEGNSQGKKLKSINPVFEAALRLRVRQVRLTYNNSGPRKMCWSKLKWPQNEKCSRLGILFVPQLVYLAASVFYFEAI